MIRRWLLLLSVCLLIAAPAAAQDAAALIVETDESLGAISPYVYGANYGPWGLVSIDMQAQAAASGVTQFRFPAGRWGDVNDLSRANIDLFLNQASAWGADPLISIRLENGTPERAAEIVRYVNIERAAGVRYWNIGNEPDLYPDYPTERLNADWRAIALAMKAVDPTILLVAPEVSQFPATREGDPYTNARRDLVRDFLLANGDLVDVVSVHRYPFPERMDAPATTAEMLYANAPEWDVLIDNLRTLVIETTGRDMPLAFTEVNSHWNKPIGATGTPDSRYHAIWWADVLGRLVRGRATAVHYFAFSTFGDLGAYGLLDRYDPRPTYYVYSLYAHIIGDLLASRSEDSDVTITAARTESGALALLIVNRGFDARAPRLLLEGIAADAALTVVEARRIDAEQTGDYPIDLPTLTNGAAIDLPAASVTLLVLSDG